MLNTFTKNFFDLLPHEFWALEIFIACAIFNDICADKRNVYFALCTELKKLERSPQTFWASFTNEKFDINKLSMMMNDIEFSKVLGDIINGHLEDGAESTKKRKLEESNTNSGTSTTPSKKRNKGMPPESEMDSDISQNGTLIIFTSGIILIIFIPFCIYSIIPSENKKLEDSDADSNASSASSRRRNDIQEETGLDIKKRAVELSFGQQNQECSQSNNPTELRISPALPRNSTSPPVLKAYAYLVHVAKDVLESSHPNIIPNLIRRIVLEKEQSSPKRSIPACK
ncbi:hypothetical protein C2G38_2210368 [Gigaspora rosea]|uniref:Uncharacterized protein n=1 Tax=Gigaspora rosea TaxID=44941 RepID=A0A397UFF1_9GLOM|nr:hypothetical protein C2G38_2210368 [Gigaspora rosea]